MTALEHPQPRLPNVRLERDLLQRLRIVSETFPQLGELIKIDHGRFIAQYFAHGKRNTLRGASRHTLAMEKKNYRDFLRENLIGLMNKADVSPKSMKVHYLAGVKMGKRVGSRTIEYMIQPGKRTPSPSLDAIAAVAAFFHLDAWQLMLPQLDVDPGAAKVMRRLMRSMKQIADDVEQEPTSESDSVGDHPTPAAPSSGRTVPRRRGGIHDHHEKAAATAPTRPRSRAGRPGR
jgi:hypothetical protein